ncbi:hypothetical protein [Mammaliicoccus sciuri]|uniref:hypothetical protein n=1 Tax=Mammaliicoccus sciuri TaxID=1296 RepID=UPI002DB603DD|nr:hypothetical protein [Mammaliicoccus sciuri]MEB5757435.1 hypothetical protein [Mammaliicoccus sciuri]
MNAEVKDEDLLFYDIEVFKHNSFVVFKDINKKEVGLFHNDFNGVSELIKNKVLVGYNNHFYDDKILGNMLNGYTPERIKEINDEIISGNRQYYRNKEIKRTLDCFQQIDVSKPSLKRVEGNAGKMILESSVDFTIDRALSPKELLEAIDYCRYDVDMTIDIYKKRKKSYFMPKWSLVERLNNLNAEKWNTTTISANVLTDKPLRKWSSIRLHKDVNKLDHEKNIEMLNLVPEKVKELWLNKDKGAVTIEEFNCNIEFGFGGLHGVHKKKQDVKDVKLLDVTSMYPSILLNINGLGDATKTYSDILEERKQVKHKDKVLSDALKLVLNSVYGNLNNQYSLLYDTNKQKSVCFYGQIALYDLCKRLSKSCEIININTDGVAFTTNSEEYLDVWKEWEKDFNLTLEEDKFKHFIQKDVNNYVAIDSSGSVKTKGGDVNNYHDDNWFKANTARIIDIAITDYLLFKKDPKKTLTDNLDNPILYQYILQSSRKFAGTFDQYEKEYQRINRIFPTKKESVTLFKRRLDGGITKFPNTPQNMWVYNDDLEKLNIEEFKKNIDLNHYLEIIIDKLTKGWKMWSS